MDLFVVPTISFRLLYGFPILLHARRELLWLGVTAHPTAEWIAQQFTEAFAWRNARDTWSVIWTAIRRPVHSARAGDGHSGSANLAKLAMQNGYAERPIRSIRRDCLDHVVVFGEPHLRNPLRSYQRYYNEGRTHLSLRKNTPIPRAVRASGHIIITPILGALHHQYGRVSVSDRDRSVIPSWASDALGESPRK
jgi:hypothetical protein